MTSFRDVVVNQSQLAPYERFNQLLNWLRGPALETVKAFQITSENYPKAQLKARYDNPLFIDNLYFIYLRY